MTPQLDGAWQRAAAGAGLLGADGRPADTIFAEMSALAASTGAINLGQGFPDTDGPAEVLEAARHAIADGVNQYPPGRGMPVLREAIAAHQARFWGLHPDPATEILVTAGATEALAATLLALVKPGDEVLTVEPFYDAYAAVIGLAGGVHTTVELDLTPEGFVLDPGRLADAITPRTRAIVVNNPHNPTGYQGEFNWSSQHLDYGGVWWPVRGSRGRSVPRARGGNGQRIGHCGQRCVHRAVRNRRALCNVTSGA